MSGGSRRPGTSRAAAACAPGPCPISRIGQSVAIMVIMPGSDPPSRRLTPQAAQSVGRCHDGTPCLGDGREGPVTESAAMIGP
eukprot:763227-Hanusia_phi.AAC.1